MNFHEQIATLPEVEGFDEIVWRKKYVPAAGGMTYGELYDNACQENEVQAGEDFEKFVKRIIAAQKSR